MNKILLAGIIIVVVLGGGFLVYENMLPMPDAAPVNTGVVTPPHTNTKTGTEIKTTGNQNQNGTTQTTTTTQTTNNTNTTNTTTGPKTFTLAQVATHNTETSCYSAINGKVYDLGAWINQHPGGDRAILSICGKDGTDAFNGRHGGQMRPEAILAGFEIGTLK